MTITIHNRMVKSCEIMWHDVYPNAMLLWCLEFATFSCKKKTCFGTGSHLGWWRHSLRSSCRWPRFLVILSRDLTRYKDDPWCWYISRSCLNDIYNQKMSLPRNIDGNYNGGYPNFWPIASQSFLPKCVVTTAFKLQKEHIQQMRNNPPAGL